MSSSKLNMTVISKLRNTSKEFIDFILNISQLQDEHGRCRGIHYKEISDQIGVKYQTFYNHRDMGEVLRIFDIHWDLLTTKDQDWSLTFKDNRFDFKKNDNDVLRYLNTNAELLYTDIFKELKLNNKILVLFLLAIKQIRAGERRKLTYKTLMEYAGTKHLPLLLEYLESLRSFFNIDLLEDGAIIELQKQYKTKPNLTANIIYALHLIKSYCRKYKAQYDDQELVQAAILYCKFARNWADLVIQELRRAFIKYKILDAAYLNSRLIGRMAEFKVIK